MSVFYHHLETKVERGIKELLDAASAGNIPTIYTGLRAEELVLPRVDVVVTDADALDWSPSVYRLTVEVTVRHDQDSIGTRTVDQSTAHDTAWGAVCDALNTIPINVNPFNASGATDGIAYKVTMEQGGPGKNMQVDAAREVSHRRYTDGKTLCSTAVWELIVNALDTNYSP